MNRLLLLITIAGCAGEPPERFGRSVPVAHTDRSFEQEYAETILREHVEAYLGVQLELEPPPVYWVTDNAGCEPLAAFATRNEDGDIVCQYGYTIVVSDGKPNSPRRCNEIYVFEYPTIGAGAFMHELGHCWHADILGIADPDHSDDDWWSVIHGARDVLVELGI